MKGRIRERETQVLPTIGRISIGGKSEKGFPVSYDYFVANTDYAVYKKLFVEAFGDKPNVLPIIFLSNNTAEVCSEYIEMRDSMNKIFCTKDDGVYTVYNNGQKTEYLASEMVAKYGSEEIFEERLKATSGSKKGFTRRLTLTFVIPKIRGVLGQWKFITYADKTSIDSIINSFDGMLNMAGKVSMIPFDLVVSKKTRAVSGDKVIYPTVNLVPSASVDNIKAIQEYSSVDYTIINDDKLNKLKDGSDKSGE